MHPNISILELTDREAINLPLLASEFSNATQQCGFVYVRIDDSTSQVIKTIRNVQRRFFSQTIEEKNRVAIDTNNRSYLANGKALMQGARYLPIHPLTTLLSPISRLNHTSGT